MENTELADKPSVQGPVRNPYLKRPTSMEPSANNPIATGPEVAADPPTTDRDPAPEDLSSNAGERRSPVEEKKDDENAPENPGSTSTPSDADNPNTGLAYWERLPSKTLSQGSAEILTIEECVKHSALYRGRAVRVTGQLHQRTLYGDDIVTPRFVLLELMDPVITIAPPTTTPGKTPSRTPSGNDSQNSGQPLHTATPGTALKTPYKTPLKTLGPRRPVSGSSLLSGTSLKTPGSNLLSSKRKRPWFATSARKKTPPKSVPRSILRVIVDPELPRISEIAPCGASKVLALGIILENGWMRARFVSLVKPDLDMTQYVKALQNRRRFLYQRYKAIVEHDNNNNNGNSDQPMVQAGESENTGPPILVLGCGPPPYNHLEGQDQETKETESS